MGYSTRTGDWEVAGLAGFGFVDMVGADASFWMFRSRSAAVEEPFISLTAAGGYSFGAGQVPALDTVIQQLRGTARTGNLAYTQIDTLTDFGFWDLHGSLFTIMQVAATAVAGYSVTFISAVTYSLGHLFQRQSCSGFTAGVQGSAIMSIGTLRSLTFFGSMR
jgi:hypothetical protein